MALDTLPLSGGFPALLRRERESRGWTLADLAARTGIALPNLSRLERGLSDPRVSTILRVAGALGAELALVPARPRHLDEVVREAAEARRRILAAGLRESDPGARLARRARRGEDTRVESAAREWADRRAG